jgi:hypothetical protein
MKYAIIENGKVTNIAVADTPLAENWIPANGAKIGDTWDGENFITPEPEPAPVALGVLKTDVWVIPADGATFATITFTSNDPVYFIVNDDPHLVIPVDQIATLEITADAPGSIRVEVQDKQLVITAEAL